MNRGIVNEISQHLTIRQNLNLKSVSKFFYQLNFNIDWTQMVTNREIMTNYLNLYALLLKTNTLNNYSGNFNLLNVKSLCHQKPCSCLNLLSLTELKIDDFSPELKTLYKLTGLTKLSISSYNDYNYSNLTNLTSLKYANGTHLRLQGLNNLRKLKLSDVGGDIRLPQLPNLASLRLCSINISLQFNRLIKLSINLSKVTNISPSVKQLKLANSFITMSGLTNLSKLSVAHVTLHVSKLTSLTSLKIVDCCIDEIDLPNLTELNIDKCNQSITHLSKLTKFSFNKMKDFELPDNVKVIVCKEMLIEQVSGLNQLMIKKEALKQLRFNSPTIRTFTLEVKCIILNVVGDINVIEYIEQMILKLNYRSYNNRTILEF